MGECELLPLKRVELSLSKFNDVAIPHHLELLRQHKANIVKFQNVGQYSRVVSEQRHCARVVTQLRGLLRDIAELRQRVAANERARFDALTTTAREDTLNAIVDFLESSPLAVNLGTGEVVAASSLADSAESIALVPAHELLQRDCELQAAELEGLSRAEAGWREVEREVVALQAAWSDLQHLATQQASSLHLAHEHVTRADHNVHEARRHLAIAHRLRSGAYCSAGLVAGALCGGPLGALAGGKAGLAAAAAGSLLGYFGGAVLDRRRRRDVIADTDKPTPETNNTNLLPTETGDKKSQ